MCKVSPPNLRRILMDQSHKFDGFMDRKVDLSRIDKKTYLQLLQYSPIWPLGSRDYLIVTSEVSFPSQRGEGFAIASTSVDDICDDKDVYSHSNTKYTRSSIRLAGFIGTLNGSGGTDLEMFVDMDVYSYVPGWLVHTLAQFCLADMMSRIRLMSLGLVARRQKYVIEDVAHRIKKRAIVNSDVGTESAKQSLSYREMALLTRDEGIEILEAYLAGRCGKGKKLEWRDKLHKQGIQVSASSVYGSEWQAVRATVSIQTDAKSIVKLLLDDSKIGLYDDLFDKCDVLFNSFDCLITLALLENSRC